MRTTTRHPAAFAAPLVLALALSACSDGAAPEPVDDAAILDADVAMVVAQATIADVADMWMGNGPATAPSAAPWFGRGDGVGPRGQRTVTFLDGDGNEMDGYDELLTATIVSVLDVSGERVGDRWSASVARHRELVLSGLAGEETERTWNGTGTDDVTRTRFDDEAGDRTYTMSGAVDIVDVVVGVPREEHPWPLSGTITHHLEIVAGDRNAERTVVVTFDGTQFAEVEVNGERTFIVDLADVDGRRPIHGRFHRGG